MPTSFTEADKGHAIEVVGGKYKGRSGFLHKNKKETDEKIYVILSRSGTDPETCKQIYKTSIRYGALPEPRIWEEALLSCKKVQPHYQTFLNKLLEAEFEPSPQLLAVMWKDWNEQYTRRQDQARCRGFIRVKTDHTHPNARKKEKKTFFETFKSALKKVGFQGQLNE